MRMKAVVMLLHLEIRCHDVKCHRKPQSHATLAIHNLEDYRATSASLSRTAVFHVEICKKKNSVEICCKNQDCVVPENIYTPSPSPPPHPLYGGQRNFRGEGVQKEAVSEGLGGGGGGLSSLFSGGSK